MPRSSSYRTGGVKMALPGLRSLHATVRLPLLLCASVVVLLLVMNMQLNALQNRALYESTNRRGEGVAFRSERGFASQEDYQRGRPPVDVLKDPVRETAAVRRTEKPKVDLVLGDKQLKQREAPRPAPEAPRQHEPANPRQQPAADQLPTPGISEEEIAAFTRILETRMAEAGSGHGVVGTRNCSYLASLNNTRGTCIDTSCPRGFHPSAEQRLRQLVTPKHMQLTPEQRKQVTDIAKDVGKRKYIFVTAASSNHYNESQALVYNMRKYILPKLHPDSFVFYYYDLGLKPVERRRVEKNCNCTVRSMPMSVLPRHARHLMCYAWKPVIIKALLDKAEVLVYMDVSVRFRDMDLHQFFAAARRQGALFLNSHDSIPNHTVESTFAFYGDTACMYWPFPELLAGFSVFHNEPFIQRVVLEPWLACAFNATCMCPVDPHAYRICPHRERRVGQCHRFDLSSLTLQMAKLYVHTFGHLGMHTRDRPLIARNDRMGFFTD